MTFLCQGTEYSGYAGPDSLPDHHHRRVGLGYRAAVDGEDGEDIATVIQLDWMFLQRCTVEAAPPPYPGS